MLRCIKMLAKAAAGKSSGQASAKWQSRRSDLTHFVVMAGLDRAISGRAGLPGLVVFPVNPNPL